MARMVFGTSLRVAADASQPLNRRVTNLVNAVEKFRLFGFHDTLALLHLATGSNHGNWTPEQIDRAVEMLRHAHDSWVAYKRDADRASREAKRRPGYVPRTDVRESWRAEYFSTERRAMWRLDELKPYYS
jgi:hypothetical protein